MNSHRETSDIIDAVAKVVEVGECSCHNCDERRVRAAERIVGELQAKYQLTPLAPKAAAIDFDSERRIS